MSCSTVDTSLHPAGLDTIIVQIYMDALPGVSGMSKKSDFFLQIKLLSFCARIVPKRHKLYQLHTAGLDTIFVQIYMDAPSEVPGVSKEPKGHQDQYLDVFLH